MFDKATIIHEKRLWHSNWTIRPIMSRQRKTSRIVHSDFIPGWIIGNEFCLAHDLSS